VTSRIALEERGVPGDVVPSKPSDHERRQPAFPAFDTNVRIRAIFEQIDPGKP
jgi:hypothetical protein